MDRDGGQKAGRDKIENEKGEDGLETDPFPLAFLPLPGIEKGQHQGDGDDGQGAGELHSDRFVQGGGSQSPHAVPGGRSCGDRGGVVDCGAGEDAESLSRSGAEADEVAQDREENGCQNVEEENYRDGLGHLFVVGINHRRGGGNGGAAADGGTNPHQSGDFGGNPEGLVQHEGDEQGDGNGADDDGKRLLAGFQHHRQIQAKSQKHHGPLQHFFGGKFNAGRHPSLVFQGNGDQHAQKDGNDPPTMGKKVPKIQAGTAMARHRAIPRLLVLKNSITGSFLSLF